LSILSNLKTSRAANRREHVRRFETVSQCHPEAPSTLLRVKSAEGSRVPNWHQIRDSSPAAQNDTCVILPLRRSLVLGRLFLVIALVTVSMTGIGCMVGPNYKQPVVEQPLRFKSQGASGEAPLMARDWWRLYGDPDLDQLIASAHALNQTLRQAVARVDEARALARVAGSYLSPTISLDPTFLRERYSGNRRSTRTGQRQAHAVTVNDWLIPLDLTYEIDVWGRIRRSIESAQAVAMASAYDLGVVQLTVETDVAQYYYNLRALDAQVQILKETVVSYREQVRLVSAQVNSGLVGPIALYQAQAQLQAALAQLQDMERSRADQEHALAILCGRPAPLFGVASNPLHEAAPPEVPAGLPAQLLVRRPDVAEAEQNVIAANAQVGVAIANFYPTFTLISTAGFESANASNLFDWRSAVASMAPRVSIPIFQGGRLTADLQATEARFRQTVAAYVNQVLIAYADVEDALTDLHAFSEQVGNLRDAVSASRNYLRVAQVQFKQGLVDYLIVIDAERTLLTNQLSLAQAVSLEMAASIRLIKALGGGWDAGPNASP
jgi:multidrug efflux system outer membrane protein